MATTEPAGILVVDDEVQLLGLLEKMLSRQGYAVVTEASAPRALELLREQEFDLLLMDLKMPDMDGITLLREALRIAPQLVGIIMTGYGTVQTAVTAMQEGAFDFVRKPFEFSSLMQILARARQISRLRRENMQLRTAEAVYELGQTLSRTFDVPTILHQITEQAMQQVESDEASIMLPTDDGEALYIAAVQGKNRRTLLGTRVDPDQSLAGWVARHHRPLTAREAAADPQLASLHVSADVATVSLPMLAGGELVGVLHVTAWQRPRPFTPGQVKILDTLANLAAIVVKNATLYTQAQEAEQELRRQREALYQNEQLAIMGQLLAGVAHELNNPLTVLKGQAALLQQQVDNGGMAERFERIARATERCTRIIRNFLTLAPRQHAPERTWVSLNTVVQEALELLAYPLRMDTVEVRLNLASALPALWAAPHRLYQAVVHLIAHAHQAIRDEAAPRQLSLTTGHDQQQQCAYLEVQYAGPDMPPDAAARLFEPTLTTRPPGAGAGLGLALCRSMLEEHGGTIRAHGQAGQGTVFRVELPLPNQTAAESAPPPAQSEQAPRERTIMVVDDEPGVAGVLTELLAAAGYRVDTVTDGATVLSRLQDQRYDLILCDIRMPEMDGMTFYRELTRLHPDLAPRVLFTTGDVLSPRVQVFLEQTHLPCLRKPFDLREVLQTVRRLLQHADQ